MLVTLIDSSTNGETTIAQAAGLCYGKPDKDTSRITRLKAHKHLATMRFAHAVILVEDISIACQNQMVRSKHLDFLVESKRYVDASSRGFVYPDNLTDDVYTRIQEAVDMSEDTYKDLLAMGVAKEDARSIIPMNTMTSMYIAGNMQAWMDMLKLRVSKHAQQEIRAVAIDCWGVLIKRFPLIFNDLIFEDRSYTEWRDNV